jgi:hypothetical protein
MDQTEARLSMEVFLTAAAPRLIGEVAAILAPLGVPVMPLKGVLLQRWVYGTTAFRPIRDVDVLVPPGRFAEAREVLRRAGFSVEREELGGWEVALRRPGGALELDLHRRLSSTARSLLFPDDMFRRGTIDVALFGAPTVLPSALDLYAHLLLHLTLHWIRLGNLHHPEDLEVVPEVLKLTPQAVAQHLKDVAMGAHAEAVLPLVATEVNGEFSRRLLAALLLSPRERLAGQLSRRLCDRFAPGTVGRRTAGVLLAPSLVGAARDAILMRVRS